MPEVPRGRNCPVITASTTVAIASDGDAENGVLIQLFPAGIDAPWGFYFNVSANTHFDFTYSALGKAVTDTNISFTHPNKEGPGLGSTALSSADAGSTTGYVLGSDVSVSRPPYLNMFTQAARGTDSAVTFTAFAAFFYQDR